MTKNNNGRVTLKDIYDAIEKLRCDIEDHYVTKIEFRPVKMIVYGAVGLILTSVAAALIAKIIVAG